MLLYNSDDIPERLWNSSNKEKKQDGGSKQVENLYVFLFSRDAQKIMSSS